MRYLLFVTLLWSFSFNLIGAYLSGHVDSYFAVLTRVLLAGLAFLPITVWRIQWQLKLGVILVGALQFGVAYLGLYRSFSYLRVPEVLLFTVFTPIYVALIDDALHRRFSPYTLVSTAIAVMGGVVIRYDQVNADFWAGFLLLQLANGAFAAGQVGYIYLLRRYPNRLPSYRYFGYFYLGALCVTLPAFAVLGNPAQLPSTALQWGILLWLGLASSALGFYWWNKGACLVDAGTLGIMNNAFIPVGLLINLLFWGQDTPVFRLALGSIIMVLSLWLNYACRRTVLR